jgi:proline dehydrogenase
MAHAGSFARRFIPGETLEDALQPARALHAAGFHLTLESSRRKRRLRRRNQGGGAGLRALDRRHRRLGHRAQISLKLTKLGADIDLGTCIDNMRHIMTTARQHDCYVRIDMENSPYTERTLEVFELLWQMDYRNIGVALQACLFRTGKDLQRMNELGARVRLVKGAYKEPATVAPQASPRWMPRFCDTRRCCWNHGTYPAIANARSGRCWRPREPTRRRAQIPAERFEFQML